MRKTSVVASATAAVAVCAGAVLVTAAPLPASAADAPCSATYTTSGQWPGGFQGGLVVTNLAGPVTSWTATFTLPDAGQTVQQGWGGTFSQSGRTVTVRNASYNGTLATGASVDVGFLASWSGSNPAATDVTLNGQSCGGSGGPSTTTSPPPVTTTSPPPVTTTSPPPVTTTTPPPSRGASIDLSYPVTREGAYGTNRYTVYRPSNPSSVPGTIPVVVFGNGACAHTNNSEDISLLTAVASHGFVVVDEGSVNGAGNGVGSGSPIPSLLTDAITWAQNENSRSGSPLAGRLDLSRVATSGHSCGGLEALVAGEDQRVKAVISLDSGFFADSSFGYSRSELQRLHSPVLFMDGGPSDVAYDNTRANYDLARVPAVLAEHSQAGHVGFITGSQLNDGVTVQVQFLDYALYGSTAARSFLVGSNGLPSRPYWTVRSKNV
jgi:Cellulose binding domain